MEIRDILKTLREKKHLTQEQLAEHVMVSRQAVSRWENGETQPNTDTLKLLSKEFDVSINTLLGSPRQLICQCCASAGPLPMNRKMGCSSFSSPICRTRTTPRKKYERASMINTFRS